MFLPGAAGGIGQPLALLLKGSPLISELSLYDIVGTEGVGADLSHIDSSPKVRSGPCCPSQSSRDLYWCINCALPFSCSGTYESARLHR